MSTLNQMQVGGVVYDIEDSAAREAAIVLKDDLAKLQNTSETPVEAGKVWGTTDEGAGWVVPSSDEGGVIENFVLIEDFTVDEEAVVQRSYAGKYRKIIIIARNETDKLPKFRLMGDIGFWEFYGFNHYQHALLFLVGEIMIPGVFSDVATIAGGTGGNATRYLPISLRLINTASYFKGFKTDDVCKVGTTIKVYGVSV